MTADIATYRIVYNSKDITRDISSYVSFITYTDNSEGKSDELSITVDDTDGRWRNAWYPTKGDTVHAFIGKGGIVLDCGVFEVESLDYEGAPDAMTINCVAAVPTQTLRTAKSYVHEAKTLREIVNTVAAANKLTVVGEVANLVIKRVTQNRESDLEFLARLSRTYGYLFNVRGDKATFIPVEQIDARTPVATVRRSQMSTFRVSDKLIGAYKQAEVSYHNVEDRSTVKVEVQQQTLNNQTIKETLKLRQKAETVPQAEAQAKAELHRLNSMQLSGYFTAEGNPLLVSGNNVNLPDLGKMSGKFTITSSTHSLYRNGGYTINCEFKTTGYNEEA